MPGWSRCVSSARGIEGACAAASASSTGSNDDRTTSAPEVRDVVLHLDVDRDVLATRPREHVSERRDRGSLAEIDADELLLGHVAHAARIAPVSHPRQRVIVEDDDAPAGARAHVELDRAGSLGPRLLERSERVLGRPAVASPAAVADDERRRRPRARRARSRHTCSSSAIERARARASTILSAGRDTAPTTGCPPPPYRSQMAAML
jgi:hypothetical protein